MTFYGPIVRLAMAVACATVIASCRGDTGGVPTAPSGPGARSGTWRGTVTDAGGLTGALELRLEEFATDASRSVLSGTWRAVYQDASRDGAGSLLGTVTGSTATLLLTPATPPPCASDPFPAAVGAYSSTMLTVAAATIEGPYTLGTCTGTITGTLRLARP